MDIYKLKVLTLDRYMPFKTYKVGNEDKDYGEILRIYENTSNSNRGKKCFTIEFKKYRLETYFFIEDIHEIVWER